MPSNISREKRRIEQESRWFYEDLTAVLKHDTDGTLARFNDMVAELKSEPSLSRETVMARFDECMREYPRFCKRVIGIRPDGTFLLVDMERSKAKIQMAIPATPPMNFTLDGLLSIVAHLPYPTLGRLAKTCKWMNAHISDENVGNAVDRFLEHHQKIELVTEHSGRLVLRMLSTNEEVVELGWMNARRSIALLRTRGRVFRAVPQPSTFVGLLDQLTHSELQKTEKTFGYVRFFCCTRFDDDIWVEFVFRSTDPEHEYVISVIFTEYLAPAALAPPPPLPPSACA